MGKSAADDEPKAAPGVIAEADGNAHQESSEKDYGPNFEQLEEKRPELVSALRELSNQYRLEGIVARRHEIRRIRQARMFWQGLQYAWWSPQDMTWHLPYEANVYDDSAAAEQPRYQFVTNLYQAFGLSFISVLSQDVPETTFFPKSTRNPQDLTFAKAASKVVDLVEQNNQVAGLLTGVAFYLWTDGKIGAYVRYVADGQRFGWNDEDELAEREVPVGENQRTCPNCGPVGDSGDAFGAMANVCAQCGAPTEMQSAPRVKVPQVTGTRRVPNGQEVITIVGGLELNSPVWANEMHEYPYLQWAVEVHKAKLKASFPRAADKIQMGGPVQADDVYARASRLAIAQGLPTTHPGDALVSLISFSRTWIRPWAFYALEDEAIRDELLELFPDGCYVAFAGEAYCEARSESMDDRWRVMHALPGDGQSRPSVGDSLVQIQEQYNTLQNLQTEHYEYGIPPIYADPQVLDFDALNGQTAEPAAHYPARARPGQPLAAGFFQPAPAEPPADMIAHKQELIGPVAQFLSGLFPAIFGGNMEDQKTATGYAMARDQALGRLGLVWRRLKVFYADVMMLSVDCFRQNRPDDVEVPFLSESGEYDAEVIRLVDLKGNIAAHPESDESFPRLKSQQRAVIEQMMGSPDPNIQAVLHEPSNLSFIKSVMGMSELVIPGEDSANKQRREIEQLLKSQPVTLVGPDGMTPVTQSTIPVDLLFDDHEVELQTCKDWANSEAGQIARVENPNGFANVRAHAQQHLQALASAQQSQGKPPSESINFKDLPPDGQAQMAGQAGIKLNPADLAAKQAHDQEMQRAKVAPMRGGAANAS